MEWYTSQWVCTRGELAATPCVAVLRGCARHLLTRDKALYQSCTYSALIRLLVRGPLAAPEGDPRRSHRPSRAFSPQR